MNLLNAFFDYANLVAAALALLGPVNPVTVLYSLLAGTYAAAASANDHHSLRRCYIVSAALHALIGVQHLH